MSMILLAVEDAVRDAPVRDLLTAEGWWVTTAVSQEEALRAAADHAPQLLIVDAGLATPGGLLQAFGRQVGGPGVLVLVDHEGDAVQEAGDGVIGRDQKPSEILAVVRRSLHAPRPATESAAAAPAVTNEDEQLTTSELFGDILETLDDEATPPSDPAPLEPEPELEVEPDPEPEPEFRPEPGGEEDSTEEPEVGVEPEVSTPEDQEGPEPSDEDADWLIDLALEEAPPGDEESGEDRVGESPSLMPEPSTDVEAAVDGLLEVEETPWEDPDPEADESDRASSEETQAREELVADTAGGAETEEEGGSETDDLERLGPYVLLEMLEYGDLTERWLAVGAEDPQGKVVVERLRLELESRGDVRQAFVDGYSEAAGWDQENLVKVIDLGRDGEVDFVATEYHAGHSLREVLGRIQRMEARMPLGIGLLLAERIVAGLQGLGSGAVPGRHGWLVPSSVWLTDEGEVLLREFGFGHLEPVDDVAPLDWKEYRFVAADYWSGHPDLRADLYSLGALLYETISGRPTYDADDPEALVEKIREDPIEPVQVIDPTIPSEVDGWIMRLLRRNPGERLQAPEEIAAKVDLALQSLPARPSNAELAAYLRQLFAARVPEGHAEPGPQEPQTTLTDAEDEGIEVQPGGVFAGRPWTWWLVVGLLALVLAFVTWRVVSTDEPTAPPPSVSQLTELPASPHGATARPVE